MTDTLFAGREYMTDTPSAGRELYMTDTLSADREYITTLFLQVER